MIYPSSFSSASSSSSSSCAQGGKAHQIFLSINQRTMSQRRDEHSSGGNSQPYDSAPRRRRIDIENLLNPSVEDRNSTARYPTQAGPSAQNMPPSRYHQNSSSVCNGERSGSNWRAPNGTRRSPPRSLGTRREFRPTYSEEETLFIWYHRIDLGLDWQEITRLYNAQFPDRYREGLGGIQCKYYRCCNDNNIPKVRDRSRSASTVQEYGMRARTGLVYPWMRR